MTASLPIEPPPHFSPSAAETYEGCPRKWYAKYVMKVPDPAGPEAAIGTLAHEVLEELCVLDSGSRTPAAALALSKVLWAEAPPELRRDAWGHVVRALMNLEVSHGDVLDVERELLVDLVGVPFKGILDRADLLPSGAVRILDYKGLALDTPLPTPSGWTTMGAVEVGDELLGADGEPCLVTVKSGLHDRPCYRVRFDDGSSIVADNEHLWEVHSAYYGPQGVVATEDLPGLLRTKKKPHQRHLFIPNAAPLGLPVADLPLDPWVLGLWLGDGKRSSGEITWHDDSGVAEVLTSRGWEIGARTSTTSTVLGLRSALRRLGILGTKNVPPAYLRGSVEQRLDLLRGLMDSDGTWNVKRKQAVFVNTDKALASAVYELVVSLGWRASWWEGRGSGFGVVCHQYRVSFRPIEANPFLTTRKASLVGEAATRSRRRLIVSVELVPTVPTACVQVDSPGSLYLCGEQMVPTHNTGKREPGRNNEYLAPKKRTLMLYAAAVEALDGRPVHEAALIWTATGKVDDFEVDDIEIAGAVRWLRRAWESLNRDLVSGEFAAQPGPLCSWCPGAGRCPEGQEAIVARAAQGKSIGPHGIPVVAAAAKAAELVGAEGRAGIEEG